MNKGSRAELVKKLVDLDKKLQEMDKLLTDIRVDINGLFWNIKESIGKKRLILD